MNKPYLIGEIGINHNGDINIAKQLIKNAKDCQFDAVKFQKRTIDIVYDKKILDTPRESPWGTTTREQKLGLEFEKSDYDKIAKYCEEINIDWFASAWDTNSLSFLKNYDLKYNKIASAMIVDLKFLEEVAKEKKHTFISTGMSSMQNVKDAVDIFKKNNCSFELMQCVSAYPFNDEKANLNLIKTLRETFNCDVGYSGHEKGGLAISCAASALGITSLERHFTTDRTMYGSDQSASLTPKAFKELVESVRKIEKAMGDGQKRIIDAEIPITEKLRGHLNLE